MKENSTSSTLPVSEFMHIVIMSSWPFTLCFSLAENAVFTMERRSARVHASYWSKAIPSSVCEKAPVFCNFE